MRLQTGHRQGRPGGPHRRGTRPPSRQRGVILVLLLLVFISGASLILLQRLNAAVQREDIDTGTRMALAQAREALLAWAVTHPNAPGLLPWPDRNSSDTYDGFSDCGGGLGNPSLFIGALPWRGTNGGCDPGIGGLGIAPATGDGAILWYAVSRNLVRDICNNCYPVINPGLLNAPTTPATVPWPDVGTGETYPWLTVRGPDGAIIADDVAAVLIAPGTAIGNQDRAVGNPADYLDAVTVGGVTYSNADADEDFIIHPQTDRSAGGAGDFNDQLVFITARELLAAVEQRVLGDVRRALEAWRIANGAYPWLLNFDRLTGGFPDVQNQNASAGFLPVVDQVTNPDYVTQMNITAWNITGGTVATSGINPPQADCVRQATCSYTAPGLTIFFTQTAPARLGGAVWDCVWTDGDGGENPERDLSCSTLIRDFLPGVDREYRINLQNLDVSINQQTPTTLRSRDLSLSGMPVQPNAIVITDIDAGAGHGGGETTLNLDGTGTGVLEMNSVFYAMDPGSSAIPEWFARMDWQRYVFIAYPPPTAEPLPGAPAGACTDGVDCLALCIDGVDCPGDAGAPAALRNVRALALSVGPAMAGQNRAVATAAQYLEGENADIANTGASDGIFLRRPDDAMVNDRARVLLTTP